MNNIVDFQNTQVAEFSVSRAIGEFGLVVPENGLTVEQHDAIGELLGRIENAGAWNRGDWYNKEPKDVGGRPGKETVVKFTTVKDKCLAIGLDQANVAKEAAVCARFPDFATRCKLTFAHFMVLLRLERFLAARKDNPAKLDVDRFIHLAVVGDRYEGEWDDNQKYRKEPWTASQLKRAIEIEYGELSKVDTKEVDAAEHDALSEVRKILESAKIKESVKKRVLKEVDTEIKAAFGKLKNDFTTQVHAAAKQERDELRAERKRLANERIKFENSNKSMSALIPKDQYNLILNCLHPDKVPEESRERYAKAFGIMKDLREDVNI